MRCNPDIPRSASGVVMMEFVIVLPLYLFLWAFADLAAQYLLAEGKILCARRYAAWILAANPDSPQALDDFVFSDHPSGLDLLLKGNLSAEFFHGSEHAESDTGWGLFVGGHLQLTGLKLPDSIRGMLLLPALFEDPSSLADEEKRFTVDMYTRGKTTPVERHHVAIRRETLPNAWQPMHQRRMSAVTVDQAGHMKFVPYMRSPMSLLDNYALRAAPRLLSASQSDDGTASPQQNYQPAAGKRLFYSFFSNGE